MQPVEAERKIDEKEEIPDGSQVQQTDGIPPDTKDDSDAESNSNLALTERLLLVNFFISCYDVKT